MNDLTNDEKILIGLSMMGGAPVWRAIAETFPVDLCGPTAAHAFKAFAAADHAGQDISVLVLRRAFPGVPVAELADLMHGVPILGLQDAAKEGRRAARDARKERFRKTLAAAATAPDPHEATARAIEHAEAGEDDHGPRPVADLAKGAIEGLERRALRKGMMGLPTGFADLDRLTGGWQAGDLIVLAARPAMGKTAFALQLARQAATLFVSLEMSAEKLMARLITAEARVSHSRVGYGLSDSDWGKIADAWNVVTKLQLWIDDRAGLTVESIIRRAKRLKLEMIVIDYLQLLEGSRARGENRQEEIAGFSRALKRAAKQMGLPVIALSQVSRTIEQRKDKRPMLSDLRESGAIEQDADLVMFLYREAVYGKTEENETRAELIVAKHRDGPTGMIPLRFQPELTLFSPPFEDPL